MKAICVVDVQKDFMDADGALPVPGTDRIRGKLAQIVKFAREKGIPLFFTQDEHLGDEPEMIANGGPFPLHCMKGTPGQENIPEVPVLDNPVFTKRCYDVFDPVLGNKELRCGKYFSPLNINLWLKTHRVLFILGICDDSIPPISHEITQVFLCGVVGNICCEAAAIGMAKRGIDVIVWSDAVVFMDLGPDNNAGTSWEKMAAAGVGGGLFDTMKGQL